MRSDRYGDRVPPPPNIDEKSARRSNGRARGESHPRAPPPRAAEGAQHSSSSSWGVGAGAASVLPAILQRRRGRGWPPCANVVLAFGLAVLQIGCALFWVPRTDGQYGGFDSSSSAAASFGAVVGAEWVGRDESSSSSASSAAAVPSVPWPRTIELASLGGGGGGDETRTAPIRRLGRSLKARVDDAGSDKRGGGSDGGGGDRSSNAVPWPRTVKLASLRGGGRTTPLVHGRNITNYDNNGRQPEKQHQTPVEPPLDQSMCVPSPAVPLPTCNSVHEFDLSREGARLLGSGNWRGAWDVGSQLLGEENAIGGTDEDRGHHRRRPNTILKTTIWKRQFDRVTINHHSVDAVIADAMTRSRHSIHAYGYCSQAILNEYADRTLEDYVKSRVKVLHMEGMPGKAEDFRVVHRDEMTSGEKLDLAIQVATAISDLHFPPALSSSSAKNGSVFAVYNDLKPENVMIDEQTGLIKISDFNVAELLKWNSTVDEDGGRGSPCHFRRSDWVSRFHSPEEVKELPLTPAIDMYALGGIIYYLLAGEEPYHNIHRPDYSNAIVEGKTPSLPRRVAMSGDPVIMELISIMDECWRYDPSERPTSRAVLERLEGVAESLRDGTMGGAATGNVLIGVTSSRKYFSTRVRAVENTWARDVPSNVVIRYFVGDRPDSVRGPSDSNRPLLTSGSDEDVRSLAEEARLKDVSRIVVMNGVVDDEYPLVRKASEVIRHMEHIVAEREEKAQKKGVSAAVSPGDGGPFDWVLDVDDDTYVHTDTILKFLASRDSTKHQYVGRRAYGRKEDRKAMQQAGLERPYCNGGPGFALSRPTLRTLASSILECEEDVKRKVSSQKKVFDDVLIGICVHRLTGGLGCWDGSSYVKEAFDRLFEGIRTDEEVMGGLTAHAFKDPVKMVAWHERYTGLLREERNETEQAKHSRSVGALFGARSTNNNKNSTTDRSSSAFEALGRVRGYVSTLARSLEEHAPRLEEFHKRWSGIPSLRIDDNHAALIRDKHGLGCSLSLLNAVTTAIEDGDGSEVPESEFEYALFLEDNSVPFANVSAARFAEQFERTVEAWPEKSPYLLLGSHRLCHVEDPLEAGRRGGDGGEGNATILNGGVTRIAVGMGTYALMIRRSFLPEFRSQLKRHVNEKDRKHYSPEAFLFREGYFDDDSHPAYVATPLLIDMIPGYSATSDYQRVDNWMGDPYWWKYPPGRNSCERGTYRKSACDLACGRVVGREKGR